jgi:GT2 family glycosyltransferase
VDFCKRAAEAGWQCWYEPASRVVHLVGRASGVTGPAPRQRRPSYWFDSRRWYFVKHHGRYYTALANIVWATAHFVWRCRRFVQRKEDCDPPRLLFDFIRHSVLPRGLLR